MAETERQSRDTIARLAADAFKDHVLKAEGPGRWLCKRPSASAYWFRVILSPAHVIVIGDLGDAVFTRISYTSDTDLLAWIRGCAVDSVQYLLSKLAHSREAFREFYPGDAVRWAQDYAKSEDADEHVDKRQSQLQRFAQAAADAARHGELNPHTWHELLSDHVIDDAWNVGMGQSSEAYWIAHALATFIRLHDAEASLTCSSSSPKDSSSSSSPPDSTPSSG